MSGYEYYGATVIGHSLYAFPVVGTTKDGRAILGLRPKEAVVQWDCPPERFMDTGRACFVMRLDQLADLMAHPDWTLEGEYGSGLVWRNYKRLQAVLDFEYEFERGAAA